MQKRKEILHGFRSWNRVSTGVDPVVLFENKYGLNETLSLEVVYLKYKPKPDTILKKTGNGTMEDERTYR